MVIPAPLVVSIVRRNSARQAIRPGIIRPGILRQTALDHVDLVALAGLVALAVLDLDAHLGVSGDRDQRLPRGQVDEAHAHGLAPGLLDLSGGGPDHATCRRDREDLVFWTDHERADQLAPVLDDPGGHHAKAAPALNRVLVSRGSLGEATLGG